MNKKNKGKRASATITRPAHERLKDFAYRRGLKLNFVIDLAVQSFLKNPPMPYMTHDNE